MYFWFSFLTVLHVTRTKRAPVLCTASHGCGVATPTSLANPWMHSNTHAFDVSCANSDVFAIHNISSLRPLYSQLQNLRLRNSRISRRNDFNYGRTWPVHFHAFAKISNLTIIRLFLQENDRLTIFWTNFASKWHPKSLNLTISHIFSDYVAFMVKMSGTKLWTNVF